MYNVNDEQYVHNLLDVLEVFDVPDVLHVLYLLGEEKKRNQAGKYQ